MTIQQPPFADLYISDCENCGLELDDWKWLEDDIRFYTTCTCGTEYTLEPTFGIMSSEKLDEDEDEDYDFEC
jgi:hypothetical protein